MGTVVTRTRKDGSVAYMAQICLKRDNQVHREVNTFTREKAARTWLKSREAELKLPGGIEAAKFGKATLSDAIGTYIRNSPEMGRTKMQVLNAIKASFLGDKLCTSIRCDDVILFARGLRETVQPQTVANYMSHLAATFSLARPAWGYPLDPQVMKDVFVVAKRLKLIAKSTERERRPTPEEIDTLMQHFLDAKARRPASNPMAHIIAFAIFSTRRQNEILRMRWDDLDVERKRVFMRDMKNPGQTKGNHVWCDLPDPCMAIIHAMPKVDDRIFPFQTDAVSASFTRTCQFLGIEDLHFHDLRHEGISRLFEMEMSIPKVAQVSAHRSWVALKRYTHIDNAGDKYTGWKWLDVVTKPPL